MTEVTQILDRIEGGDPQAADQLLPLVYDELRRLAAQWLASEKPGQTLQPTALVHEAYVRLVDQGNGAAHDNHRWVNRAHFFSAAAEAMRRNLIEKARHKRRLKHGGGMRRTYSVSVDMDGAAQELDLLSLDEALSELESEYPEKAKVVQLRFFAGLTHEEVAQALGWSLITVKRHWRFARVWLHRQMSDGETAVE